jgi:hypothetical protein
MKQESYSMWKKEGWYTCRREGDREQNLEELQWREFDLVMNWSQ